MARTRIFDLLPPDLPLDLERVFVVLDNEDWCCATKFSVLDLLNLTCNEEAAFSCGFSSGWDSASFCCADDDGGGGGGETDPLATRTNDGWMSKENQTLGGVKVLDYRTIFGTHEVIGGDWKPAPDSAQINVGDTIGMVLSHGATTDDEGQAYAILRKSQGSYPPGLTIGATEGDACFSVMTIGGPAYGLTGSYNIGGHIFTLFGGIVTEIT